MYNLYFYKYFKVEKLNTDGDIRRMYTFKFVAYFIAWQIRYAYVSTHTLFVSLHN